MFIVLQFPLADLRPMISGQLGRLSIPDWNADDPGAQFIRGFGPVAARNSDAFGLIGERTFADFNQAVRYNFAEEHLWYGQKGWSHPVTVRPWFRRFYFDGHIAGRFEFGFLIDDDGEAYVFGETKAPPYDPGMIAHYIESIPVLARVADTPEQACRIRDLREPLAQAYVGATTARNALLSYPIAETAGTYVAVGSPTTHIRGTRYGPIAIDRGSRSVQLGNGEELFITSVHEAVRRNSVIVQFSPEGALRETPRERAIRVLFSHLNALIFALSHYVQHEEHLERTLPRKTLRASVTRLMDRLSNFTPTGPFEHHDEEFAEAVKAFGSTYSGRLDELFARLSVLSDEFAKPTVAESAKTYLQSLFELILTTAVKAAVETASKGR